MDECIAEGVLADFLSEHRAEAVAMSIYEYDEEKHMKAEREEHYALGLQDGVQKGRYEAYLEMGLSEGKPGVERRRLRRVLMCMTRKSTGRRKSRIAMRWDFRKEKRRSAKLELNFCGRPIGKWDCPRRKRSGKPRKNTENWRMIPNKRKADQKGDCDCAASCPPDRSFPYYNLRHMLI